MDSRAFNVGAFDVQSVLKCKGTFVGHQVCFLQWFTNVTIKVWPHTHAHKVV